MHQPPVRSRQTSNLNDRAGNGLPNNPKDIFWVKEALRRLGRYNHGSTPNPYIDRSLNEAILNYQRDRGLRRDGVLVPGGETECALCVELARLFGRARR
ncbi:peptidoglycan-binding domain-containing protein [Azospirillum sp.]|uniref:peptidoglycan-binding domain-containing protein n=1 Tax=Azospirillum sp. TaxID=34012 RepID=UPI0039C87F73